jgi:hypothetical protein
MVAYLVFAIESVFGFMFGILRDAWSWTYDQLSLLVSWVFEFAGSLLPAVARDIMSTDMLKRVASFFEFIDGLLPVTEMFSIWITGLVTVFAIRTGRWVFACIPTLGG